MTRPLSSSQVRKSTEDRRREIADAILGLIGERGFSALTTTVVAERIGVTSGALFRHFRPVAPCSRRRRGRRSRGSRRRFRRWSGPAIAPSFDVPGESPDPEGASRR